MEASPSHSGTLGLVPLNIPRRDRNSPGFLSATPGPTPGDPQGALLMGW